MYKSVIGAKLDYSCFFFSASAHAHNSKLNQLNQSHVSDPYFKIHSFLVIFGSTYRVESRKSRLDVGLRAQQCRFGFEVLCVDLVVSQRHWRDWWSPRVGALRQSARNSIALAHH